MPDAPTSKKQEQSHILVVDDDREITETLKRTLTAEGYKVSVATDGNQGVAYAETQNPDLVILDMMMPRRSGFLVLERLIQSREVPIPVIMITGNEGSRHQEYAEMLGVSDYLHKPFTMDRLIASITNLLDGPSKA